MTNEEWTELLGTQYEDGSVWDIRKDPKYIARQLENKRIEETSHYKRLEMSRDRLVFNLEYEVKTLKADKLRLSEILKISIDALEEMSEAM